MQAVCPYCKDSIDARSEGVRCARCATPHHRECWKEHGGACSVAGCGATDARPFTRRAATRIVLGAGKHAVQHALETARARLGGKTVVGLLLVSMLAVFAATGLLARAFGGSFAASVEVALAGVFVVVTAWIATLLYRGDRLEDDLRLGVAASDVGSYYRRLWSGLTGERGNDGRGCGDCSGCSGIDGEGFLLAVVILVAVAVLLAVGPLVAWVALELVYPLVVLAVYGLLYAALSYAAHAHDAYQGRLGASVLRGALFAGLYTGLVAAVFEVARRVMP